jgi:hypothetical protein
MIEQGWGFWPAKPKTDVHRLDFGLVHANGEGTYGGCLWEGGDLVVEVLGGRDEKIEQRRGFGPQNQKSMHAGSILVWCPATYPSFLPLPF